MLYKHIIQVENKNVGLKVGRGAQTYHYYYIIIIIIISISIIIELTKSEISQRGDSSGHPRVRPWL